MFPSVPTPPVSVATHRAVLLAALAVAAMLLLTASDADARSRHTVEHNADGGTTARTGVVRAAPGGGGVLRGRSVSTDGQGHGSVRSGAAVVGPNGATAVRQGQSARKADGTASHSSTLAACIFPLTIAVKSDCPFGGSQTGPCSLVAAGVFEPVPEYRTHGHRAGLH